MDKNNVEKQDHQFFLDFVEDIDYIEMCWRHYGRK